MLPPSPVINNFNQNLHEPINSFMAKSVIYTALIYILLAVESGYKLSVMFPAISVFGVFHQPLTKSNCGVLKGITTIACYLHLWTSSRLPDLNFKLVAAGGATKIMFCSQVCRWRKHRGWWDNRRRVCPAGQTGSFTFLSHCLNTVHILKQSVNWRGPSHIHGSLTGRQPSRDCHRCTCIGLSITIRKLHLHANIQRSEVFMCPRPL